MRVAAIGDVHIGPDSVGTFQPGLAALADDAEVLLVAGDLTKCGTVEEAKLFIDELDDVSVPVVAVLGNHDHHADRPHEVAEVLRERDITVLEGTSTILDLPGGRLGVAGVKGFGGGFSDTAASAFGEHEMKAFVRHTQIVAAQLCEELRHLAESGCDRRVALLHYAPIAETVAGERREIYPFLGSQLLGEAIDEAGADLAVHGHAHSGIEHGTTPGGVPVRNVALPVIGCAYRVYVLGDIADRDLGDRDLGDLGVAMAGRAGGEARYDGSD
jgi:Icc-related predicted phosphoesterase